MNATSLYRNAQKLRRRRIRLVRMLLLSVGFTVVGSRIGDTVAWLGPGRPVPEWSTGSALSGGEALPPAPVAPTTGLADGSTPPSSAVDGSVAVTAAVVTGAVVTGAGVDEAHAAGTSLAAGSSDQNGASQIAAAGAMPGSADTAEATATVASARSNEAAPCVVSGVARSLLLDSFYRQACVVDGLPVVADGAVDGAALVAAARILQGMLQARPDLLEEMAERHFRLGIIATDQRAVDLPEYRDLPANYPQTDWDAARAYGATPRRPLAAVPEENLLCNARDTYPGQSVLTHELGHSVLDMAVIPNDGAFAGRVAAAFNAAAKLDVYRNTYAMTNADEYWAEGVQDFFNASRAGYGVDGGGDGYDGPIASRETLRRYDPALYSLIAEVFTEVDFSPVCPT